MSSRKAIQAAAAKWYLADLLMQTVVDGRRRSVVHINTILVRATSNEDAYAKGRELGREAESAYKNEKGKTVRTRFRGFAGLCEIHDKLEHGGEIAFTQHVGWSEAKIKNRLTRKKQLAVFAPRGEPIPGFVDFIDAGVARKIRDAGIDLDTLEKPKRK